MARGCNFEWGAVVAALTGIATLVGLWGIHFIYGTEWGTLANVAAGGGTLCLAVAAYWTIRRESHRERRLYTPLLTFDFFDAGQHENLGPPGFRHIQSHPRHSALRLSGALRNLSVTSAVDCRLDIYVDHESGKPIHEIEGVALHNGLAAADKAEVCRLLTLDDLTPKALGVFDVGILGLFSRPVPTGKDYPFAVVLSYKNALGDPFFTAYALHNGSRFDANIKEIEGQQWRVKASFARRLLANSPKGGYSQQEGCNAT